MWVPLVENNEHDKPGADYFVKEYMDLLLSKAPGAMDAVLLACTHYPLLKAKIAPLLPPGYQLIAQERSWRAAWPIICNRQDGNALQQARNPSLLYHGFSGRF